MKILKILALFAVVVFTVTSIATYFGIFLPATTGPINVGTLSQRSREFVESQQDRGSARWQQLNVLGSATDDTLLKQSPIATPCFSLVVPWRSSHHREDEPTPQQPCVFRATLHDPLSHFVVASYRTPTFDQDSHVLLRRSQPEQYLEQTLNPPAPFTQASLFTGSHDKIIFVHDGRETMISVAVSELTQPELITANDLQTLLDSLTLVQI